jgi:hypothetical protein
MELEPILEVGTQNPLYKEFAGVYIQSHEF